MHGSVCWTPSTYLRGTHTMHGTGPRFTLYNIALAPMPWLVRHSIAYIYALPFATTAATTTTITKKYIYIYTRQLKCAHRVQSASLISNTAIDGTGLSGGSVPFSFGSYSHNNPNVRMIGHKISGSHAGIQKTLGTTASFGHGDIHHIHSRTSTNCYRFQHTQTPSATVAWTAQKMGISTLKYKTFVSDCRGQCGVVDRRALPLLFPQAPPPLPHRHTTPPGCTAVSMGPARALGRGISTTYRLQDRGSTISPPAKHLICSVTTTILT